MTVNSPAVQLPITALCDQLDQLRAAATKGAWHIAKSGAIDAGEYDTVLTGGPVECMAYCYGGSSTVEVEDADAALIVAAVNALPQLTAALRAVEALAETWHQRGQRYAQAGMGPVAHDLTTRAAAIRTALATVAGS
jgi:hypothetical protein